MDVLLKNKDTTSCIVGTSTTATYIPQSQQQYQATTAMANISNSDSFSIIPSANSNELNAAASLSDDSGVPLTTNSSISSGDSYRMCKFEIEMVESDGEVSQFDSLDNCSEGGMSGENFNTLKKGPLAPIDPPPEFQDSPQSTLVRSISKNLVNSLRRWTSSQSSFEHLKDRSNGDLPDASIATFSLDEDNEGLTYVDEERTLKDTYALNKHLYSSDSILNSYTDNIYDEPNNIISTSLGNSIDIIESDGSSPVPPPPPPVSIVKIKQTLYQDHTRYFKAIPSEQDHLTVVGAHRFNAAALSEIHDYDLYYGARRTAYHHHHHQRQQSHQQQQHENSLQRKHLYSPLQHAHYCQNHHYHHHAGMGLYGNRPNSRNSLNSRLSSSHNSLRVSSANKPDDSIFITQAMSHDALLTREISDFYNVPIDSDIYAFPVDMIPNNSDCGNNQKYLAGPNESAACILPDKDVQTTSDAEEPVGLQYPATKTTRRQKRNRHAKNRTASSGEERLNGADKQRHSAATTRSTGKYKCIVTAGASGEKPQEPLHMTLDEVKQFYHTLYADGSAMAQGGEGVALQSHVSGCAKANAVKTSNETIWSTSSTRSRGNGSNNCREMLAVKSVGCKKSLNISDCDNISNNNNNNSSRNNNNSIVSIINQQNSQQTLAAASATGAAATVVTQAATGKHGGSEAACQKRDGTQPVAVSPQNHSNLIALPMKQQQGSLTSEKRSQFTLSLKQKFCSIFRFRRGHNRCRGGVGAAAASIATEEQQPMKPQTTESKRKKFQTRALPPLPKKKDESVTEAPEEPLELKLKSEPRSYQFTSSIEKVKDYGWYWGPLSSEAAEKVLSNEPDGSFIVRDSSDDHYIFSLSFKLNNCVRHVRIEQDQGTFSFGSYAKFKSQTITEFIEKAVEHSRSGRYLFFLHRRPEHGPLRVQLTNPVSRFKHVQSLQHMCRFVILKAVIRKDLIQTLPLPRRLLDYLNYKHCYSEQVESDSSHSQISGEGSL